MHSKMSYGADEVRSGCVALDFISYHDFLCIEFMNPLEPEVEDSFTPTRTYSKYMPNNLGHI